MGLVRSRGQIWQEVQCKNPISLTMTHKHRIHRRLHFSAVKISSSLCAENANFICSFDLLFLRAVAFPLKLLTALRQVRPVRGLKYIFICAHLVKEWWVCNGTAEECGVELHLRFWFLRTERDLRGSLGWWWWCDSLLPSLQSQSHSVTGCVQLYNDVFRGHLENPIKLDERVPTLTQYTALENKTGYAPHVLLIHSWPQQLGIEWYNYEHECCECYFVQMLHYFVH